MIYAYVADVHIGNHKAHGGALVDGMNARACMALETFKRAIKLAADRGAVGLIVCGDLFDVAQPTVGTLYSVAAVIKHAPIEITVLAGNHDSMGPHHSTPADLLCLVGAKPTAPSHEVVAFTRDMPSILRQVDESTAEIFIAHVGLEDEGTPPWLVGKGLCVSDLMRVLRGRAFFAGDWHSPRIWERAQGLVVQCGALCPTGWDNQGEDYGRVWFFDTATKSLTYETVPGPRFFQTFDQQVAKDLSEKSTNFVRLVTDGQIGAPVECSNVEIVKPQESLPERDAYRGDSISGAVEAWISQTYPDNHDRVLAAARRLGA